MRTRLYFVALLAGLVLAGCGGGGAGDSAGDSPLAPESSATGGPAVSSFPPANDPTASGKYPGGAITITGTPTEGVENGCIVMQSGDTLYLLLGGDRSTLMTGRPVQVRGTPAPGLMTTCQQGTPFQVTEVRPA